MASFEQAPVSESIEDQYIAERKSLQSDIGSLAENLNDQNDQEVTQRLEYLLSRAKDIEKVGEKYRESLRK